MKFRPVLKSFSIASEASNAREPSASLPDDIPLGLTVLHPKNGDDEKVLVDIITIHGLSGHPKKTWTNSKTGHYWPLKSLPQDIPLSRIMAFGYSTNTSPFNNSTAIISDIAKSLLSHLINKRRTEKQKVRPMIFVAHSLGGIVLKEFLHVASNTGNDDMAGCVCGILFLGTPHKGSDLASFLNVLNAVTKSLFRRPPDVIIQDLSTNSRHLLELDQLLRFKLGKIDIYSFYELKPMGSLKNPVVERHSALMNLPSEIEQIGLDADHRQMCKPLDRNDFIYETIVGRIINIMHRQIDREQFSKELMKMTNDFATRQMEQISLLAAVQSDQKPSQAFPAIFMASFSETRGPDLTVQPNALVDVLKDLPRPKAKEYLGGLQKLFERAESLHDMLRFAERQSEQIKVEAMKIGFEARQKADKQKIADLKAENEQLKEQLRALRLTSETPEIPIHSKEPITSARRSRRSRWDSSESPSAVEEEPIANIGKSRGSRRDSYERERMVEEGSRINTRRSRRDSYERERMVEEEPRANTRRSRRDSFERESMVEEAPRANTSRSRRSRRDSFEMGRMFEEYRKPRHVSHHENVLEGYKLTEEEQRARDIYEEAKHSTIPGIAAAIASAAVVERRRQRRSDTSENSSRPFSAGPEDLVQEEADRYYRESVIARRIACEEDDSPERSLVDKWRDDGTQFFPITIPSEVEEHEKERQEEIYDGPNADVLIDNTVFPHQEHQFRASSPMDMRKPIFMSKDPSAERERPVINLVYPTPVPSREASPSPSEQEITREGEPEPSKFGVDDVILGPEGEVIRAPPVIGSFTWGENEANSYEVESPDLGSVFENYVHSESSDKRRTRTKKASPWSVIAAPISRTSAESIDDQKIELSSTLKEKDLVIDSPGGGSQETSVHLDLTEEPLVPGPKPARPRSEHMPSGFADDAEFVATLAAGLVDTGFDPNIAPKPMTFCESFQDDYTVHTGGETPYVEPVTGFLQGDAEVVVAQSEPESPQLELFTIKKSKKVKKKKKGFSVASYANMDDAEVVVTRPEPESPQLEWSIPTKSKKAKKKKKKEFDLASYTDMYSPEDTILHEVDKGIDMQADNAEKIPESDEEKLVQTRIKSEDILNSLRIALTQGQQLFESLGGAATNTSDQESLKGSDEETEYSYDDEGSDKGDDGQDHETQEDDQGDKENRS